MNQDAKNMDLLRRLSRGEYVVDAKAVAEAILRRRGDALKAPSRPSEVLETPEREALPALTFQS